MIFKSIAKNIVYEILNVFTKVNFSSNKKVFSIICFHTEWIANQKIFNELFDFSKWFLNETGKQCILCITTPYSPQTQKQMKTYATDEKTYAERVRMLADVSHIGYHGHFFHVLDPEKNDKKLFEELYRFGESDISKIWKPDLVPINRNNYSFPVIRKQIDAEISWLKENIKKPEIYTAGFWFLTKDIVLELERHNFKMDSSIREFYKDTFGESYLDINKIPKLDKMFLLPPSKSIIEIASTIYLSTYKYKFKEALLKQFSSKDDSPIYYIFPLHDQDLINNKPNIMKNINLLRKFRDTFNWMDIYDMREAFLRNRGDG